MPQACSTPPRPGGVFSFPLAVPARETGGVIVRHLQAASTRTQRNVDWWCRK